MAVVQGTPANGGQASSNNPYADRTSGSSRAVPPESNDSRRDTRGNQGGQSPNLTKMFTSMPGGVSRNEGGVALSTAISVFTKLIEKEAWSNSLEIKLIPVDHSTSSALKISAVVLAVRDKANLDTGVAYHAMILAASMTGPITPKRMKIDMREVDVVRTADNGNDQAMVDTVQSLVESVYPGVTILPVPATTVPLTVNLKDADEMNRLLKNGLLGCITYLQEASGVTGIATLKELASVMRFVTALSFDQIEKVNDVQLPLRSDFAVTLSSNPSKEVGMSLDLNDGADAKEIMTVRGYVDIAWTAGQDDDENFDNRRPRSTARYIPKIIATQIYMGDDSYVSMVAIALGMLNALRNNTAWMAAMPMAAKQGDLSDYGILSLETPIDPQQPRVLAATPFRSDDEGRAAYHDFLRRMIRATPQLCVDVPLCGPETWQLGFLMDIADGNSAARQLLIDTINQLTDNKFGDLLTDDDWLVRLDSEVHMGTYRNAAGELRDMREIGYVQMANAVLPNGNGPNNPLQQWSNSWVPVDAEGRPRAIELRMDERLRAQTTYFGAMNVTGTAQRLEFSTGLLDGIARAFASSSFHPVMTGFKSQLDSYSRSSFSGHTMASGHAGDLFRRPSSDNSGMNSSARYGNRGHRFGGRNY